MQVSFKAKVAEAPAVEKKAAPKAEAPKTHSQPAVDTVSFKGKK